MTRKSKIDQIIEDATMDCYDEYECFSGWATTLEDELKVPQECLAGKVQATLVKIDQSLGGMGLHAKIKTKEGRLVVPIETITLKDRKQNAYIEAYKKWL